MIDPNDPNYRKKDHRMLGIGLTVGAALLIAYACVSHRWLENTQFEGAFIGFSLLSFEACMNDTCETKSNFEIMAEAKKRRSEHASSVFAPAGIATLVLLGISALALLGTAAVAWTKKRPKLAVPPQTVALLTIMLALLAGCAFIGTKPGGIGAVGVGIGFWAFGIGSVLGIVGAQILAKMIKPIDPDLPAEL